VCSSDLSKLLKNICHKSFIICNQGIDSAGIYHFIPLNIAIYLYAGRFYNKPAIRQERGALIWEAQKHS